MSERAGYIPLVGSLIHSTIWREPDHVRLLWITMLCMADADGYVMASVPGLADAARITVEQCRKGLAVLMAPDPDSRDQTDQGRRVFATDGGWVIPAVPRYREKIKTSIGNAERCRRYRERAAADRAGGKIPPTPLL